MEDMEAIAIQIIQECPAFQYDSMTKQNIGFWWNAVNHEFDEHHIPIAIRPKVLQFGLGGRARRRFPQKTYPANQNGLFQLYDDLQEEFSPERNRWFEGWGMQLNPGRETEEAPVDSGLWRGRDRDEIGGVVSGGVGPGSAG